MFKSFRIGKLFKIPIYLHWSFLLLPLIAVYISGSDSMVNILWAIAFVFTLFFCVLLHEFGHVLSARYFGVDTHDIILSIIGGVARLKKLPERPIHELIVAIAGPMVNVGIVLILSLILFLFGQPIFEVTGAGNGDNVIFNAGNFIQILIGTNIVLAVFNLIPAFPMDGGRVLRSLLNMKLSRLRATFIAMILGQIIAVCFAVYGIYEGNYTLSLIAVFIISSALTEYRGIKNESFLSNHLVADAMKQQFQVLQQSNEMDYALQVLKNTGQQHFAVLNLMKLEGVLTHKNILKAITDKNTSAPISDYMTHSFTTLSPNDGINKAYELFQENHCDIIPIVENDVVIGILDGASMSEFLQIVAAKK